MKQQAWLATRRKRGRNQISWPTLRVLCTSTGAVGVGRDVEQRVHWLTRHLPTVVRARDVQMLDTNGPASAGVGKAESRPMTGSWEGTVEAIDWTRASGGGRRRVGWGRGPGGTLGEHCRKQVGDALGCALGQAQSVRGKAEETADRNASGTEADLMDGLSGMAAAWQVLWERRIAKHLGGESKQAFDNLIT
jgi:hypothetical protein